jgi:hypothetical protein
MEFTVLGLVLERTRDVSFSEDFSLVLLSFGFSSNKVYEQKEHCFFVLSVRVLGSV